VARGQGTEVHERHAMVLVVVGHEGEAWVFVDHVPAEHRAVPVAHVLQPVGLKYEVSELGRGHGAVSLSVECVNGSRRRYAVQACRSAPYDGRARRSNKAALTWSAAS